MTEPGRRTASIAPLDPLERKRLLDEARAHSRRLQDDPNEKAILDEIEQLQAENALEAE